MYERIPNRLDMMERQRHLAAMEGGDDTLTYTQSGEIVLPVEVQERFPTIALAALSAIRESGGNPSQYVVGSPDGNYNDETGVQQFNWLTRTLDFLANSRTGQSIATGLGTAALSKLAGADTKQALATGLGSGLGFAAGDFLSDTMSNNRKIRDLDSQLRSGSINQSQYDTQVGAIRNPAALAPSETAGAALGNLASNIFGSRGGLTGAALGGSLAFSMAPAPAAPAIRKFDPNAQSPLAQTPLSNRPQILNTVSRNEAANISATPPEQLPIAPITPQGIRYLTEVKDRDTGRMEYVEDTSPFSRSVNEMSSRRSGFGSRISV